MVELGSDKEITYTVLLCVDYDEKVLRRYNELLKLCEIQGGSSFDNLYITKRNLRITKDRVIQYNLILGLGGQDAFDIANRVYRDGGEIAVAFFDLKFSKSDMMPLIQSVKNIFPALICAVAIHPDSNSNITRPAELFSSPSEWVYFMSDYRPEQMEQLIAHLISSFVLHREKEVALAKNEATREGLRQILDASPELLKKQNEQELGQLILKKLRILTGATNTYLLTLDAKTKQLHYLSGTGEFLSEATFQIEFLKRKAFLEGVLEENKTTRMKDRIFVPLWVQDKAIGILFLDREHMLTKGTELMEVFAHHVAFALENQRIQIELEQKQAWEHELSLASRIQESLLPKSFPDIAGLDVYGLTKSAKEIGGDYFDVLGSEKNFYMCIGDVSGKGVPAGLIMSELRSFVRSFAMSYTSPKEVLMQSARLLLQDITGSGKFVSMLLLRWDGKRMYYSSAGHEHIIHYRMNKKTCEIYRSGGVVLGVDFRNFSRVLKEKQLEWEPGDLIFLFTDGATEAKNTKGDMFTLDRVKALVEKYWQLPAKQMLEAVLKEIMDFIGDAEQHDDITLLGIKYFGKLKATMVNTKMVPAENKEVKKDLEKIKEEIPDPFNMF